jgi:colicin import membrane protein
MEQLPVELAQIAENVSIEKRTEVQNVLNHVFNGVSKMREQLDTVQVQDHNDKVNMKLANTIRLGVRNVRLEAEKTFDKKRDEVQQAMLSFKTEDSLWLKAKQTMQILTKEIEANAKWKEETKERFEAEQKELKIQERILKVSKFSDLNRIEFENMTDETFEMFLAGIENQYNQKIEAEKKAEEERIAKEKADAEAREKQRLENERLKAEAEKREKEIQEERAKAKAEADKIQAENKAKLKAEQEAKAKLEAELQAKKDAELKAENERKQAELKAKIEAEKLAKAPVKKQLQNWVNSFEIPSLVIENEKKTSIEQKFEAFKNWALKEVDSI